MYGMMGMPGLLGGYGGNQYGGYGGNPYQPQTAARMPQQYGSMPGIPHGSQMNRGNPYGGGISYGGMGAYGRVTGGSLGGMPYGMGSPYGGGMSFPPPVDNPYNSGSPVSRGGLQPQFGSGMGSPFGGSPFGGAYPGMYGTPFPQQSPFSFAQMFGMFGGQRPQQQPQQPQQPQATQQQVNLANNALAAARSGGPMPSYSLSDFRMPANGAGGGTNVINLDDFVFNGQGR